MLFLLPFKHGITNHIVDYLRQVSLYSSEISGCLQHSRQLCSGRCCANSLCGEAPTSLCKWVIYTEQAPLRTWMQKRSHRIGGSVGVKSRYYFSAQLIHQWCRGVPCKLNCVSCLAHIVLSRRGIKILLLFIGKLLAK